MRLIWFVFCLLLTTASSSWAAGCDADELVGTWRDTETDGIWHFKSDGAIECEGDCVHYVPTLLANAPVTGTPLAWEINSAAEIAIWFHDGDKEGGNCSFVAGGRLLKVGGFTFQRVN